ncbi:MAG TPA: hypothetical protein VGX68_28925 [Thermoanaerobaculia bacterium]|jgi:hypothetical protein|nr:hypothetical protein [Thermoanaerobaculia bacterium]
MSLLSHVADVLRAAEVRFALIGASAMAAHGVGRSTLDQDLLVVNPSCLQPGFWKDLQQTGVRVEVRRGDAFDPLAGVVRFEQRGERPVDLVVGKFAWQRNVIQRAMAARGATEAPIPVARAADIILLKLFAGGPQDAWDIEQILSVEDRESLIAAVDAEIAELPAESAYLWRKILGG